MGSARAATARDASALASGLQMLGVQCTLETRDGLALLITGASAAAGLHEPEIRRSVLALAGQCGFTHVAVELSDDHANAARPTDATVPRD